MRPTTLEFVNLVDYKLELERLLGVTLAGFSPSPAEAELISKVIRDFPIDAFKTVWGEQYEHFFTEAEIAESLRLYTENPVLLKHRLVSAELSTIVLKKLEPELLKFAEEFGVAMVAMTDVNTGGQVV